MGRPKKTDRESVKEVTLTLKLTAAERARLDALVAQREAELSKLTGQRIEVSASAFLRWLMDERARAVGVETPREPEQVGASRTTANRDKATSEEDDLFGPVTPEELAKYRKPVAEPNTAKAPALHRSRTREEEVESLFGEDPPQPSKQPGPPVKRGR